MGGDKNEKITTMVLKADLQCSCCYKKVKKILCKFPQIRDQVYDEKANSVTIKVLCCNPEKIRDKLCCEGRGVITSIEIIKPVESKPKVTEPDKSTPDSKKTTPSQSKSQPQPQSQFSPMMIMQIQGYPYQYPQIQGCQHKTPACSDACTGSSASNAGGNCCDQGHSSNCCDKCYQGHSGNCCDKCYQGHSGGPCYHHARPIPPPPSTSCYYFSEENASGCSIM